MIPKTWPGNELAVKNCSYQAIYDADDAARRKQSRDDPGSALPRHSERSDRQDGNTDARPWREPGLQRPTHSYDDDEHDERCGS
jgi:hypothetical protein